MQNKHTRRGFTLIELLVVVLIIGILAAVAVPQYRLAIEKSRFMELITLGDAVYKAEQVYYLANGNYATDLNELDMNIDTKKFTLHLYAGGYAGNVLTIQRNVPNAPMSYAIYYKPLRRECRARKNSGMLYKQTCRNLTGKEPTQLDAVYDASAF